MSRDVNVPSQSNENIPTQLQNNSGNNGKCVIILTPDMLKQLGLSKKAELYESKSKADHNISRISPFKTDNNAKKLVTQEVLKSTELPEVHINSHNSVEKTKSSSVLLRKIDKNEKQNDSLAIHRLNSKNEIVHEQLHDNPGHNISFNTFDSARNTTQIPDSKTSTKFNCTSQIHEKKQNHKKSSTILLPPPITTKYDRTSPLKIKTYPCHKSVNSKKLEQSSDEIVSPLKSSVTRKNKSLEESKAAKKLCEIKQNKVALLKKNYSNSSSSSSSSSAAAAAAVADSKTLLTSEPSDIDRVSVDKNSADKKLVSMNTIKNDDVIEKGKSSQSKHESNAKRIVEQSQPAQRTSRRVSKPKTFDDCIVYDVPNRKTSTEEQTEVLNDAEQFKMNNGKISGKTKSKKSVDHQNKTDKMNKAVKNPLVVEEKFCLKTVVKLKNDNEHPNSINNKKILVGNELSSPTSRNMEEPDKKNGKSKMKQSKILKDNFKNDHDKTATQNNDIHVPEVTKMAEIPNTIPVLEIPIVTKGRGRPRKNAAAVVTSPLLPNYTIPESNPFIEVPNIESPMIIKTNGIDNNPIMEKLGRRRSKMRVEVITKNKEAEVGDTETDSEELEEEEYKHKRTYRRKRGGYRGRGRGRGRHPIGTVDADYTPRTSESNPNQSNPKKRETIDEELNNNIIICGKCNEKLSKNLWAKHNLGKHNNMGWRVGDPVPDYENNEKLWRSILTVAHKRKKGSLLCEKCCTKKRSVIGFISHYQFCGKSDEERKAMKWTCLECHGVFMPSSQDVHERMHRDEKRQIAALLAQKNGDNKGGNAKGKRKAAENAATKISEFTGLVKDEVEPRAKKIKIAASNIKDLIEYPRKTNAIPSMWKGLWMNAIAANEKAECRQLGCTFSAMTLDEIYKHHSECKFTPILTFTCKICKYSSETLDDMKKHVRDNHVDKINLENDSDFSANESSDESEVEDNASPVETLCKSKPLSAQSLQHEKFTKCDNRATFLLNEKFYRQWNDKMTFVPALNWSLEFEMNNYSLLLFEDFKPNNFILLRDNEAQDYLPKLTKSMRIKQTGKTNLGKNKTDKQNKEWSIWERFESSVVDGFPTFFVGGPVWAMAWLPIPTILYSQNVNQYIAISTHPQMNDSFIMGKSYKFKNIIQIWNLGHLEHSLSYVPHAPQLAYAIAHDKGTIWCMEWCPSGAYENSYARNNNEQTRSSIRRMGLLAVASSDGCVHIYSIAFPDQLNFNKTDNNNLPIYKTHPIVTLQINPLLHEENNSNWQCLSLNWSKILGHDTIAAGFTNGYVALWDLITKSPLLITRNNSTLMITSYLYFCAHKQSVTGVTIIPLKGKRFLATCSIDRCSKFWDLEDVNDCVGVIRRGMVLNSAWMTHWPNILSSYDNALGLGHTVTYMIGIREPYNKVIPLLPTNSPTYGLATSDYANGICHGTSAGELVALFPFQLMYFRDLDKIGKKRWLVSAIEVVDFEAEDGKNIKVEKAKEKNVKVNDKKSNLKEYIYMPETYEKCSQRFGIIFQDDVNNAKMNMKSKSDRRYSVNSDTMKAVPVEQYNFTSINRISWNPNAWSYLWLAVGYQNGFIRILHFKSMSMGNAIIKLLPDHTRMRLNKENEMTCSNST